MIDIHSHIRKKEGVYNVEALLADMKRFSIDQRVISTREGTTIRDGIKDVAALVRAHPTQLVGCAYINPGLQSVIEDVEYALSLEEIKLIEFNSYDDGYAPDSNEYLDEVFQRIANKEIPVKVFTGIGAKSIPQQWEIFTQRYPRIPFIFLHMGCFDYGYSCVDVVARNDNAYIETSNQYENQILKKAFTQLSANKILFGTSYPSRFTRNAIEIFDLFDLDEQAQKKIFHHNAMNLLR